MSTVESVFEVLDLIGRRMWDIPNTQSRLCKFIDILYGSSDNTSAANESRWQKLRALDCATFLFVAVSYTPLDISKMHRIEFDYLVEHASKYLQAKALPPKWMFRREIQVALAAKAELDNITEFRKSLFCLFAPTITHLTTV